MSRVTNAASHGFYFVVWAVIAASIVLIVAGGVDVGFGLGWGFSIKDVVSAVSVLLITLLMKVIGKKALAAFDRS